MAKVEEKKKKEIVDDGTQVLAYNVKAKQKQVMLNPVIEKTARGGYMARGIGEDGTGMAAIMGEEKAKAFVKAGVAKKKGW